MDEPTARRVLDELSKLAQPLNELTALSTTFPTHEEQKAFRRILGEQLMVPCVELYQFVYRQHPGLDPDRRA